MTHAYQDATEKVAQSWKRIHANGEETHVHILTAGERHAAIAVDINPIDFEIVDSAVISYSPTKEGATEQAYAWMEQHPKGVAGGGGGGSRLMGLLKKINDYGENLADQQNTDTDADDTEDVLK